MKTITNNNNQKFVMAIMIALMTLFISSEIFAFEKSGTTSFQFLSIRPSARAASLGGAYTTMATNSEACFWNPAGLQKIDNMDFSSTYTDYIFDVKMYSLAFGVNQGSSTFGAFALFSDVGNIEETVVENAGFKDGKYNPGLTGNSFRPKQFVGGVSFAQSLTESFTFGINVKYVLEDLIYSKASAVVFDGGILFNTGYKSIVVGAAIKNFGPEVKFVDSKYPIPQTLNIGVSANLIGKVSLLMPSDDMQLALSYDLIQPRDFDQQHALGFEYSFNNMIDLRAGYKFNGDQESYAFGFGFKWADFRLDYAYTPMGDFLPTIQRISFGYNFK